MLKYRLDINRILEEMAKQQMNFSDLSRYLGWSRSLLHFAIFHGSKSFAPKIAKTLGIDPCEIIISAVKGGPASNKSRMLMKGGIYANEKTSEESGKEGSGQEGGKEANQK